MSNKSLWEILWDYDPNCLLVVDPQMTIHVTNAAFNVLFQTSSSEIIGKNASVFFDDLTHFKTAWEQEITITEEKSFLRYGTFLRLIIFPLKAENLIACIMVNLTKEHEQDQYLARMKEELLNNVNLVIDKQMGIAQQIAGLLGETTAEAKVSLIKIRNMLNEENKP